jgi:hypothetical protein
MEDDEEDIPQQKSKNSDSAFQLGPAMVRKINND